MNENPKHPGSCRAMAGQASFNGKVNNACHLPVQMFSKLFPQVKYNIYPSLSLCLLKCGHAIDSLSQSESFVV